MDFLRERIKLFFFWGGEKEVVNSQYFFFKKVKRNFNPNLCLGLGVITDKRAMLVFRSLNQNPTNDMKR